MTLRIKQESTYTGSDWWTWAVWLDGPAEELDQVDHVIYTLHPTFPTPVQRVGDRESRFRLESAGWGEFEIYLDIGFKNGQTRKRKHWLHLRSPAGKRAAPKRAAMPSGGSPQIQRVFLSYGVADAQIGRMLGAALTHRGLEVLTAEDMISKGIPFEQKIDDVTRRADAAVFILSGRPSLWVMREIETALDQRIPHILPVLVGEDIELPARLRELQAIRIMAPTQMEQIDSAVESICAQLLTDEI